MSNTTNTTIKLPETVKVKTGYTGIEILDNLFTFQKEDDSSSKYYNDPSFEDGETVSEKLTGLPVIDAYLTLIISLIGLALIIFLFVFTINKLS
jgi:hypothetical protein